MRLGRRLVDDYVQAADAHTCTLRDTGLVVELRPEDHGEKWERVNGETLQKRNARRVRRASHGTPRMTKS